MRRRLTTLMLACAAVLFAAPAAQAEISTVFNGPNAIDCVDQGAAEGNLRFCGGSNTTVPTFDGTTPVDVNVALPAEPAMGADGPYPLVMMFHGWGGSESSYSSMKRWADRGYAVFSMTDRGWGMSCGGTDPKRLTPACANGYIHLLDTRFEVRDAQHFAGVLADEGVAQPTKIGAIGGSYGGGLSMSLGALKNRVMNTDGSLSPWKSPGGTDMEIAAAAPEIPWTDLANSLMPNGATLDYVADAPYRGPNGDRRIGIQKQSFVALLFAVGLATGNYAAPGTDPDADIIRWYAEINAGEPYDENPLAADLVDEVTSHHSSYYIDHSVAPAPLLISNGWTDDLFPADEAIRFYNRTRTEHPGTPIALSFLDYGHMRGQAKGADVAALRTRQDGWFDHFLKGEGAAPYEGVITRTQTCPSSAPSGGPFQADTWAALAPGEVQLNDAATKTILPLTNDTNGPIFDPGSGLATGGACAQGPAADQIGGAIYRLPAAPAGGYTLMGSPTVVADLLSVGPTSQIAARLVDVDPGTNQETLVARGLWRPNATLGLTPSRQVFQLHPNGYKFEAGHIAKLELLPSDIPYGRVSNGQLPVAVSNLDLRLPVVENPDGGFFKEPGGKVLPPGYELAADFLPPADVDADDDGFPDDIDNCQGIANPLQTDSDGDAAGDACDPTDDDADNDARPDDSDNCNGSPNPLQLDTDGDGTGDACEGTGVRLTGNARLRAGKTVAVALTCDAPDSVEGKDCNGTLELVAGKARKRSRIAGRSFSIAGGKSETMNLALSRKARKLLRKSKRLKAAATASSGGSANARSLTLVR